jgi:hypothetical protein
MFDYNYSLDLETLLIELDCHHLNTSKENTELRKKINDAVDYSVDNKLGKKTLRKLAIKLQKIKKSAKKENRYYNAQLEKLLQGTIMYNK